MWNQSLLTERGHNRYLLELRELARENRKKPTRGESLVWNVILKKKYLGYGFLRQKPLNQFILDFYCPKLLLAIEIDGDSHVGRMYYDKGRDDILRNIGIKTFRINNEEVLTKLAIVKEKIMREIDLRSGEL